MENNYIYEPLAYVITKDVDIDSLIDFMFENCNANKMFELYRKLNSKFEKEQTYDVIHWDFGNESETL